MASLTKGYSVKIKTIWPQWAALPRIGLQYDKPCDKQRGKLQRSKTRSRHHNVWRYAGLLLTVILIGCAGNTPSTPTSSTAKAGSVKQLLDAAHSSTLEQRAPYLIDAAALSLQQNNLEQTTQILQELNTLKLTTKQNARSRSLLANLQLKQRQPALALNTLQDRQLLQDLAQLSVREQIDISLLRAQALAETRNYFASVQELVFVEPLLNGNESSDKERAQNHQQIWRALMAMSVADLERYRSKTDNDQLRGWLELATIAKRNAGNPSQQETQLADWSRRWSTHPAAQNLPADLTQIRSTVTRPTVVAPINGNQPKQVALLLPLSGKLSAFGSALRDGFMAAWYQSQQRGENPPLVRIYDTDSNTNIVQLYQLALSEGATLVVGPLEKQQVAQLYQQNLPVPTLALNRFESNSAAAPNLFQFSLAAEDETAQIADIAAAEEHRSTLIIVPDDEMRSRELQIFQQRWLQRGGNIGAVAGYRDQQNMSQAIRTALNIPRSEARAKELESILNRNIEFTPHRRQDIDMVFILAKPAQARVIKPLLDFYYASDLTVYSTSRIYSGYPIPNLDKDLDKVRFTEMPFVLQNPELKQQILSAQPQSKNYLRLYAMGIDSFNLCPRLTVSGGTNSAPLAGQTGQLTINADNVIQRDSLLAVMHNGNLESAPITAPRESVATPMPETRIPAVNIAIPNTLQSTAPTKPNDVQPDNTQSDAIPDSLDTGE
jgi:outer membrane PBP1 activator LpoA protein